MKKRAFIVSGPMSSGNRLLGAILVRAGCWGEGSTRQPKNISDIPVDLHDNVMWIKHGFFEKDIIDLKAAGFDITVIIIIREPEANCHSIVAHKHLSQITKQVLTLEEAYEERIEIIKNSLDLAYLYGCHIEIITYEGLCNPMLKLWLARLGLRNDNLDEPLKLVGQKNKPEITSENFKYY